MKCGFEGVVTCVCVFRPVLFVPLPWPFPGHPKKEVLLSLIWGQQEAMGGQENLQRFFIPALNCLQVGSDHPCLSVCTKEPPPQFPNPLYRAQGGVWWICALHRVSS